MMRLNRAGWLFAVACNSPDGMYLGKGLYHLYWWFRNRGYIEETPDARWKQRIAPAGREALQQAFTDHSRHGRTIG